VRRGILLFFVSGTRLFPASGPGLNPIGTGDSCPPAQFAFVSMGSSTRFAADLTYVSPVSSIQSAIVNPVVPD
jgi:hypothetical protein